VKRREIVALFGIGIARPVLAQSEPTPLPIIGFLGRSSNARDGARDIITAFRRGLSALEEPRADRPRVPKLQRDSKLPID